VALFDKALSRCRPCRILLSVPAGTRRWTQDRAALPFCGQPSVLLPAAAPLTFAITLIGVVVVAMLLARVL
jgi:hypothetical protein